LKRHKTGPTWFGKRLEQGEVRTVATVVVKSDRPWSADEIEGCLWDGHHGKEATKTGFHVEVDSSWGPTK